MYCVTFLRLLKCVLKGLHWYILVKEYLFPLTLYVYLLYLMNINKDILAFYWLRFVMWFYFIFRGMTTKSSKEIIIYHVILPVDIDRLKKLKWRPINPVSIEIWNSIQLLHFIEYIQQYFCYVVAVSYIGGGSNWQTLSHIVVDPTTCTIPSRPRRPLTWMCIKHLNIVQVYNLKHTYHHFRKLYMHRWHSLLHRKFWHD